MAVDGAREDLLTLHALDDLQALHDREERLRRVSLRLLLVTGLILTATVAVFAVSLFGLTNGRFPVSWLCFGLGVLGGFVSIEQRLKHLSTSELALLASAKVHILVHPLFGGIFAVLLYVLMLSGLVEGALLPAFSVPVFGDPATSEDLRQMLLRTYPASGEDLAKLIVWAFTAGFSERLVPDLVDGTARRLQPPQQGS